MSQQFRTNSKKQHYPLRDPSSGVAESSFREGDKNILGTPQRGFSRAVPTAEIAHINTQNNYLKSLNRRFAKVVTKEGRASGAAEKNEKKREKSERHAEADKNLELANKFMERQEKLRRGENPPPVDVIVNVEQGPALPKNLSNSEKQDIVNQRIRDSKKEESIIKDITEPPKVEKPSSPAMARPSVGNGHVQPSENTEEVYAYAAAPAFTTGGKQPEKPKQKKDSDLSLSEQALVRYPAKG